MRRSRLYLETSVFGFYFDERECNRPKREATRQLFAQIGDGIFEGVAGAATVLELEKTGDSRLRDELFGLLDEFGIEVRNLDNDLQREVATLANEYVVRGAIPNTKIDDAIHIATMVVRPELDILVTWNCRHIANLSVERRVRAITLEQGYEFNFRIMTPEEVIVYEE
jgi:hypothetical protein